MIVTVNTDASFIKDAKKGSYAFWIASNAGRVCGSGLLRKPCSRPEIAEFRCLINAIHVLGSQKWAGISHIIVNTDCLNVIHLLKKNKEKIRLYNLASWGNHLTLMFEETLKKFKLNKAKIEYRHVRSHIDTDTPRTWVNEWCDQNAKKVLAPYVKAKSKKQ